MPTKIRDKTKHRVKLTVSDETRTWAHNLDDLRTSWGMSLEKPTNTQWMPVVLFSLELGNKSRSDLVAIKTKLLEQHVSITSHIERMQRYARQTGSFLDRDRYQEIWNAKKSLGYHIQAVDAALTAYNAKEYKEIRGSLQNLFIDKAREMLPSDVFANIMEAAKETWRDTHV